MPVIRRWASIVALAVLVMLAGGPAVGKQNVVVELFYNGVWNDHSADLDNEPIVINHSAGAQQVGIVPSDGSLRFKNPNGRMNPDNPKGPFFGLIGEKTPIRVKVSGDIRLSGRAVKWQPRRSLGGTKYVSWVDVTIGGKLRELGQGEAPVRSAMTRSLAVQSPLLAWWPLEKNLLALSVNTAAGSVVASPVGPAVLDPLGKVTDGVLGTSALIDLSNGTRIDFPVPDHTLTPATGYAVEVMIRWQPGGFTGALSVDAVRLIFTTSGSGVETDRVNIETNTSKQAFFFMQAAPSGSAIAVAPDNVYDGATRHFRVEVAQSGSDVAGAMKINGVSAGTASLTSTTLTKLKTVSVNFVGEAGTKIPAVGQVVVYNTSTTGPGAQAYNGYLGELAGPRFTRVCAEEGIASTIVGDSADTQPMGPQPEGTVLAVMQDIVDTDGGRIYDTRAQEGVSMRTGRSLYNQ